MSWNDLPQSITGGNSPAIFRKAVKNHALDEFRYNEAHVIFKD